MKRIGVFGGSFDPVHYGHLILAEQSREQANLDTVLFVPAFHSPLKNDRPHATDDQRVAMLELAISGHPNFATSRIELDRQQVSYTIDTLRQISTENPDSELFLLIGADSLSDFHRWKKPAEICALANLLVINRPHSRPADFDSLQELLHQDQIDSIRKNQIESPLIEISSTDIRDRVAAGRTIRHLLPRAVEKYIETSRLYVKK